MTENEWLACKDPRRMLEFLGDGGYRRKLRLLACGYCRRVWELLTDERSRACVQVCELYADGLADDEQMDKAMRAAGAALTRMFAVETAIGPPILAAVAAHGAAVGNLYWLFEARVQADVPAVRSKWREREEAFPFIAHLLRDLFGNPFHPVSLAPAWQTAAVLALARAAYEDRILPAGTLDTDRLAVLADALEEAGCDNTDILDHLRGIDLHVRGCWCLDLVLGQE